MKRERLKKRGDKPLSNTEKGEICAMYRQALDKKAQIKILSELYLISRLEVCDILLNAGFNDRYITRELERKKRASNGSGWSDSEEERLRDLRKQKLSYVECARVLGRSRGAISSKIYELGI